MQKIGELPGSWRAKHDSVPPELAKILFARVKELSPKDPSPVRIARQLSVVHKLSISPGTVRHWIVGDRKPQGRNVYRNFFKEEPSCALSYIIGANKGDGCALAKSGMVKLEVTDEDFAQAFNANMATLFSRAKPNKILVRRRPDRIPMYIVKYSCKPMVRFLRQPLEKLLAFAFAYPREFLRGFFDAEGHADVGVSKQFFLAVGAENTNETLLLQTKELLESLGIRSRIIPKRKAGSIMVIRGEAFVKRRSSFSLVIGGIEGIRRFANQVGFSILRKATKLQDAITIIDTVRARERPQAWRQLYVKERGEWVRRTPGWVRSKSIKHEFGSPSRVGLVV